MTSRTDILDTLRGRRAPAANLPELVGPWIKYPNARKQFAEALAGVGGECVTIPKLADVAQIIAERPKLAGAKKTCCCVPGLALGNVELNSISDPHKLEDVDVAIAAGEFAVAENGAVWITDRALRQRVILFIPQHLVLVVPAGQVLHTMHDAYRKLSFGSAGFGVFISGPSKTADIEQSLVIGAHGPRSLTVCLVEEQFA